MTAEDIRALIPGDRVLVRRDREKLLQNATVIGRPSRWHAEATEGFLWVRFDGRGIDEIRQLIIHAREVLQKQG